MSVRATGIAAALATGALLVAAPSALGFSVDNPSAVPATTQAGANTDVTISFDVGEPSADLRDLTIHLPPGLVGNPLATTQCTEAELTALACPPESAVGTISNDIELTTIAGLPLLVPVPQTVNGQVFNVTPREGEPARFGIILTPLPLPLPLPPPLNTVLLEPIVLQSPARLRESDFGLDSILTDLPNTANVLGDAIQASIDITGVDLTLNGEAGNPPQGFIRLPTSCKEHVVGFDAVAHDEQTASATATFTTTGCEAVPFSPELSARARVFEPGSPIEFSTTIAQTIEEAGLERAVVTLPSGISGRPELLANVCPRAEFESGSCPANTIVGHASAASPLQPAPLTGPVAIVEPLVPGLPDVGLDLRGSLALKLTGALALREDGRNVTTFSGLPDIPIADFTLTFPNQPGLIAAVPDVCDLDSPIDGAFTAHSGATLEVSSPMKLEGCDKPRASIKVKRRKSTKPRLALRVTASSTPVAKVRLKLRRKFALTRAKRKFARGASARADGRKLDDRVLRRRKRWLTVALSDQPASSVLAKLGRGALTAKGKIRPPLRFRVIVVDANGEKTTLAVLAT